MAAALGSVIFASTATAAMAPQATPGTSSNFPVRVFYQQFNTALKPHTWSIYQGVPTCCKDSMWAKSHVLSLGRRPCASAPIAIPPSGTVGVGRPLDGAHPQPDLRALGGALPNAPRHGCRHGRRAPSPGRRHGRRLDRGVVRPRRAAQPRDRDAPLRQYQGPMLMSWPTSRSGTR